MAKELAKNYDASKVEDGIYQEWEESGFFNPDNLNDAKDSFTISMPPPNATGVLHTGHAVMLAVEDLMIRHARMNGKKTLWVPGIDHASIATQNKVEKLVAKEGTSRHKLGRNKFLKRVDQFVDESSTTIKSQIRKMGASCDWSRERFTLDDELTEAVGVAFKSMYDDGLIYRGDRVVNWCPRCHSTLADDEVEYKEQKTKLYWIKYGPFVLATTRPETKLGDTAVAVNPSDKRYKDMVGKEYDIPGVLGDFKVKVIADRSVDPEFGSGAVKVTPAHSFIDSEMAQRNNIPAKQIIDEDGKMMENCGKYAGMTTTEAREEIVKDMTKMGLIDHIDDDYDNKLSICYRCGTPIEPLPSLQWFVAVDKKFKVKDGSKLGWKKPEATLKELAIHTVKSNKIKIVPERFEKTYFNWMENLHDWCISRQIWYGHRIPVWFKGEEVFVGQDKPDGEGWTQDEDTLDTWFSSALWTFSTLGWPKDTKDLKMYHPTAVMETGYDILFFWVARMILMTTYHLNDIPFETVYLHGLVRAEDGRKMSKSLDNAVDPIILIDEYGTDALRLSMLIGVTPGNDSRIGDTKVAGYRNFVNKLWNISRFILGSVNDVKIIDKQPKAKTLADKWIIGALAMTNKNVSESIDDHNFSIAGELLQKFTTDHFADWYLEVAKIEKDKDEILLYVLQSLLKMWHPFIPFITEEIWKNFNGDKLLIIEDWPAVVSSSKDVRDFELIQKIIIAIRNARSENNIEPKNKSKVTIYAGKNTELVKSQEEIVKGLKTGVKELVVEESGEKVENSISVIIEGAEIYISKDGLVDAKAEKEKIAAEISEAEKYIKVLERKLGNKEFVANAPEAVVNVEKEKLQSQQDKLKKLTEQLNNLK
jgi:valyl-tRNA synthetase